MSAIENYAVEGGFMHRFHPLSRVFMLISFCLGLGLAMPVSAQEDGKETLYGMFRQSPEGGIVFVSPQETGVIYLPFDPNGIMNSSLDIQVQVKGSIRDSFNRNGKTYRVLTVDSISPMTAEYGSTTIQSGRHVGLPGTDSADVHAYRDKTCYLYPHYAVLETLASYSAGHILRVLDKTAADDPAAVCETLEGTPLFEIPNGGDFSFAGLSGDTLFIQNGQPNALHGLMAVNLAKRRQILNATVLPGASVTKGILSYTEKDNTPHSCPSGMASMRKMRFDLSGDHAQAVGSGFCKASGEGTPF